MTSNEHRQRMERRAYLLRKRGPQYHVTMVRDNDNRICAGRGDDLQALIAVADLKAPAYVVNDWARPTPEVVYVALKDEVQTETRHYMETV